MRKQREIVSKWVEGIRERMGRGMTQEEIGVEMGMSQGTVSRLLVGKSGGGKMRKRMKDRMVGE